MHGVHGVPNVAGGTIPAQLWHDFMTEALAPVPVTDFGEPAPIEPYADRMRRLERGGIDAGAAGFVSDLPAEEPYIGSTPVPAAVAPTQVYVGVPGEDADEDHAEAEETADEDDEDDEGRSRRRDRERRRDRDEDD